MDNIYLHRTLIDEQQQRINNYLIDFFQSKIIDSNINKDGETDLRSNTISSYIRRI